MGLRRFLRDHSGAAAAEMALVVPGLAFVILNVVDLSTYIYTKMQVDLAAHEAVGAARVLCATTAQLPTSNCTGLSATMLSAARSTTLGNNVSLGTATDAYYCANTSGTLVLVATPPTAAPANCSATVSGSTAKPGEYISVTATYTFSPVFPGASVASVLPASVTRTAWMRLK